MADTHCLECHHWDALDATQGVCHRHAPQPSTGHGPSQDPAPPPTSWPLTQADDWCGEFSPMTTEEAASRE